jgi:hypothetical protein
MLLVRAIHHLDESGDRAAAKYGKGSALGQLVRGKATPTLAVNADNTTPVAYKKLSYVPLKCPRSENVNSLIVF